MPKRVVRGIQISEGVAKEVDFTFEDDPHRRPRLVVRKEVAPALENVNLGFVGKLRKRIVDRFFQCFE